jgi:hypothetical protein
LNAFLASYIIKDTLQRAITKHYEAKTQKSFVRIAKLNDQLQLALNQMVSLQIHVNIILRILEFGSQQQLTSLKTNSIQLLIEKITSYPQGFLANSASVVQHSFRALLNKSISLLRANPPGTDNQLSLCLLILMSRTACARTFNESVQQECLAVIQEYHNELKDRNLLQLQT